MLRFCPKIADSHRKKVSFVNLAKKKRPVALTIERNGEYAQLSLSIYKENASQRSAE
jgi:hypothetical protein